MHRAGSYYSISQTELVSSGATFGHKTTRWYMVVMIDPKKASSTYKLKSFTFTGPDIRLYAQIMHKHLPNLSLTKQTPTT